MVLAIGHTLATYCLLATEGRDDLGEFSTIFAGVERDSASALSAALFLLTVYKSRHNRKCCNASRLVPPKDENAEHISGGNNE